MIDELCAWLNSKREYHAGAILYSLYGSNDALKNLFLNGPTPYNTSKLLEELKALYYAATETDEKPVSHRPPKVYTKPYRTIDNELVTACDTKAKNLYKELMNKRAVLFNLCKCEMDEDENAPDKVKQRGKLAFELLEINYAVDKAYDELAYVRTNGTLPGDEPPVQEKYSLLPDAMVKHEIDNLRKNLNKIKKKPVTPQRLVAIKEHEDNLKKLEQRWASLTQAN
jgi:hypothetical protein